MLIKNKLFSGDNLDNLRDRGRIPEESVGVASRCSISSKVRAK
jgi:hypothetical protein